MTLPQFIACNEAKQITELKSFLNSKGAKTLDTDEAPEDDWTGDLQKCIKHVNICWENDSIKESETDYILTTIACLVLRLTSDYLKDIIDLLCTKFETCPTTQSQHVFCILLCLNTIYTGLPTMDKSRYKVYYTILSCATKRNALQQVVTDSIKVTKMMDQCDCTIEERRDLWRKLHDAQQACGDNKRAIETMIRLLSTYNDSNAGTPREDAINCIISVIQDKSLSFDQLLKLKPIQFLEGETIYKLLKILINGSLVDLQTFIEKNKSFFKTNNLTEEACLNKMRLFTLMQIAEGSTEISYKTIQDQLELKADEVESFILEAISQRVISCKLDEVQQRVIVTGTLPRNFGATHWKNLYNNLVSWRTGLDQVQSSLGVMIEAGRVAENGEAAAVGAEM